MPKELPNWPKKCPNCGNKTDEMIWWYRIEPWPHEDSPFWTCWECDEPHPYLSKLEQPKTDFEHLRRILGDIVSIEHADSDNGLLTTRFNDGTRLSFGCGENGRLNMVVIQHGPNVPELIALERNDSKGARNA